MIDDLRRERHLLHGFCSERTESALVMVDRNIIDIRTLYVIVIIRSLLQIVDSKDEIVGGSNSGIHGHPVNMRSMRRGGEERTGAIHEIVRHGIAGMA